MEYAIVFIKSKKNSHLIKLNISRNWVLIHTIQLNFGVTMDGIDDKSKYCNTVASSHLKINKYINSIFELFFQFPLVQC